MQSNKLWGERNRHLLNQYSSLEIEFFSVVLLVLVREVRGSFALEVCVKVL